MSELSLAPQLNFEAVVVLAAAIAAVAVVNLIPTLNDPFELLFVTIHELGHVLATVLTGGISKGYIIYPPRTPEMGGKSERQGGNSLLVKPAGYLSTTLFSAGLILATGWPYAARYTLSIVGLLLILAVMTYGNRSSFLTMLTGLGFGLGFILIAWQADLIWTVFLLYFLAIQGAVTALYHLGKLAWLISKESPVTDDDATIFAQLIGCAPGCVVIGWFVFSVVVLGAAFWFVWLRPSAA